MAGVTKEEVDGFLRRSRQILGPLPASGPTDPLFRGAGKLLGVLVKDGLDPGPHPSLKAIEGRLEEAVKLLAAGFWDTSQARFRGLLGDIRSGNIPPAPTEAEVAKLRAELAEVSGDLAAAKAPIGRQSAEIDGLRSAPEAATRIDSERCLEIARLKADLQRVLENNAEQAKALDVAKREIAALQDRNARQYETIKGQDAEIRQLKAEIANAKAAADRELAAARDERDTLKAEVERLRRTVETGIIRRPTWKIDLSETTDAVAALADGVTRLVGRLEQFESEVARLNEINDRADRDPAGA